MAQKEGDNPSNSRRRTNQPHPRTAEIVAAYTQAQQDLAAGIISQLPTLEELGRRFDVHGAAVYRVLRISGLRKRSRLDSTGVVADVAAYIDRQLAGVPDGGSPPSRDEIARVFGLDLHTIDRIITKIDRQLDLAEARREAKKVDFSPSQETAWFLGAMVGGGRIDNGTTFTFTSKDPHLRRAFQDSGERILHTQATERIMRRGENPSVLLHSTAYAQALGDFHREERTNTITTNHPWVIDGEYLASFVSGVFDSGATLKNETRHRRVEFNTTDPTVAQFYQAMLIRLGIESPVLVNNASKRYGISGVAISNLPDLKRFASVVTSVNPEKQQMLGSIKQFEKPPGGMLHVDSPQQLIDQWRRLTAELGHSPSSQDIRKLRAADTGRDVFSVEVFARHFGMSDDGKYSFTLAQQRLEAAVKRLSTDAVDPLGEPKTAVRRVLPNGPAPETGLDIKADQDNPNFSTHMILQAQTLFGIDLQAFALPLIITRRGRLRLGEKALNIQYAESIRILGRRLGVALDHPWVTYLIGALYVQSVHREATQKDVPNHELLVQNRDDMAEKLLAYAAEHDISEQQQKVLHCLIAFDSFQRTKFFNPSATFNPADSDAAYARIERLLPSVLRGVFLRGEAKVNLTDTNEDPTSVWVQRREEQYNKATDGTEQWFGGLFGNDTQELSEEKRQQVTLVIDEVLQDLFPNSKNTILGLIQNSLGLKGLDVIDATFSERLAKLVHEVQWGKTSPEFKYLVGMYVKRFLENTVGNQENVFIPSLEQLNQQITSIRNSFRVKGDAYPALLELTLYSDPLDFLYQVHHALKIGGIRDGSSARSYVERFFGGERRWEVGPAGEEAKRLVESYISNLFAAINFER